VIRITSVRISGVLLYLNEVASPNDVRFSKSRTAVKLHPPLVLERYGGDRR
jgi:hypothetical protein